MEKIVYLVYHPKRSVKWPIIGYLLGLFALGTQTASALVQKREYAFLLAALFLAAILAGMVMGILTRRQGIPRIAISETSLVIKLTLLSRLRTIHSMEIARIACHPGRVELFLKADPGHPITLAPQSYEANKQLKEMLREYAVGNQIPCTD